MQYRTQGLGISGFAALTRSLLRASGGRNRSKEKSIVVEKEVVSSQASDMVPASGTPMKNGGVSLM